MQERLLFNANNRLNSCSRTSQFSIDGIVQCRRRRYGKEQVYSSQIRNVLAELPRARSARSAEHHG